MPLIPTGILPAGLNIPTSAPTAPMAGVAPPAQGFGIMSGRAGVGMNPFGGKGTMQTTAPQGVSQQRQFPISPLEGGGNGPGIGRDPGSPGGSNSMQDYIARSGGSTNGFGYGR